MEQIPQDYEAEQAVLGAIIYDNSLLMDVKGLITPDSFYVDKHSKVYGAILELDDDQSPIDDLLIGGILKKRDMLEYVGGVAYLAKLEDCAPSSMNAAHYAEIVNEKHRLRMLIESTTSIANRSHDRGAVASDLVQQVLAAVEGISSVGIERNYHSIKEIIAQRGEAYDNYMNPAVEKPWIKTGFYDLDKVINGLQKQKLYIIAGRPAMGKSSLLVNIILKSKKYHTYKGAIVIVTYEMSKEENADRLVTTLGKVNYNLLQRGQVDQDQMDSILLSMGDISEMPIVIIDKNIPVDKLPIEFRKIEKEYGFIETIYVDYLQITPVAQKNLGREQQISLISRSLKQYSKDYDCPVVALSQLNRDLEKRSDKKPMLADLRESGAIEQDADVVAFVYRDEVYNDKTEEKGIAQIIIDKNRSGPISTVRLGFVEQHTLFNNITTEGYYK